MTGNECRPGATFSLPQAPQGDGRGKDGRLGFVGLVQLLFRPLLGQRPEVIAESLGGLAEGIEHQLLPGTVIGEHGQGLRTLTGEDECEGCRHE